jgi:hypothetical protein
VSAIDRDSALESVPHLTSPHGAGANGVAPDAGERPRLRAQPRPEGAIQHDGGRDAAPAHDELEGVRRTMVFSPTSDDKNSPRCPDRREIREGRIPVSGASRAPSAWP